MPNSDLNLAAKEVITEFNTATYEALKKLMDSGVILKKVLHPGSVSGIGNVIGYLDTHMKDSLPQLLNLDAATLWSGNLTLIPTDASQAVYGRATGTGVYSDGNGLNQTKTKTKISFTLDFVREGVGDNWSLNNSFATPIP
jgi:hypothetical protein